KILLPTETVTRLPGGRSVLPRDSALEKLPQIDSRRPPPISISDAGVSSLFLRVCQSLGQLARGWSIFFHNFHLASATGYRMSPKKTESERRALCPPG